jgi:hypothetical protein
MDSGVDVPPEPAVSGKLDPGCGLAHPGLGHQLLAVPTSSVEEELSKVGHIAGAQPDPEGAVEPATSISRPADPASSKSRLGGSVHSEPV